MINQRKQSDKNPNNGPRILIVDDDPTFSRILAAIIEKGGYQPSIAESAEVALELYSNDPFPLVFSDLRLPGIDGIELLQKIRQSNEDTQVVIITGHASLESSLQSLREGAYDYLIKPLRYHSLVLPLIKRALDKVRLIIENRYLLEKIQQSNSELETTNKILRDITLKDGITGLYNQRYLMETFNIELKRSRRHNRVFSILFCDIDYFKQFNDKNGHLLGDKALERFSKLILKRLRITDFASRYGGEEFVLLLPETDKASAFVLADDIRRLIQESDFDGQESQPGGKLTVSIGISSFPVDGDSEDALLTTADKALYHAKNLGRNQVIIYDASR